MKSAPSMLAETADSVKLIPLTQGLFAIVDPGDYNNLSKYKWYASKSRNGKTFYAKRWIKGNKQLPMHRLIIKPGNGFETDHRNGNGLDNRRSNLRRCTRLQNRQNQHRRRENTTSRFKGVSWHQRQKKWQARINHGGKTIWLGRFDSEIEAAKKYNAAALEYFGEFSRPNDISVPLPVTALSKEIGLLEEFLSKRVPIGIPFASPSGQRRDMS